MTVAAAPGPRWLGDAGQVALAGVLALVLLPVGWTSVVDGEVSTAWEIALLIALVALHTAVATARRWPLPSYAVGALAELVLVAAPDLAGRRPRRREATTARCCCPAACASSCCSTR